MVGTLNTNECQALALLNNELQNTEVLFCDPNDPEKYYVTLRLKKSKRVKIDSRIDAAGIAHISLEVNYKGIVGLAQNPEKDYISDPRQREKLRRYCERELERRWGTDGEAADRVWHGCAAAGAKCGRLLSYY